MSISTGVFPDSLKLAKVTPIFKADDRTLPSNYRPISVLPIFSKILEKIMHNRLVSFLDKHNILSNHQYGFREKHSTFMALISLIDKVTEEMENKYLTLGIFIDLSKAFDTINHDIMLYKLQHYGINGVLSKWFNSYLKNRQQFVQIGQSTSKTMTVVCGVPQGSILEPLLFITCMHGSAMQSGKGVLAGKGKTPIFTPSPYKNP